MTVLLTLPRTQQPTTPARARAFVFEDPSSRALAASVQRVAASDVTVLLNGETGTGKEIVARYIHERSRRAAQQFVAVNCGALSESLLESELFGHVRGAFTGATADKLGWFEAANRGTLFLDEVGDLSRAAQVKLLRVLQEREVVRLGSQRTIPVDVRLVAATNVDLEEAVAAGRFRSDLYYRLAVARVGLEPLRRRPGDVLPLARHFAAQFGADLDDTSPPPTLTPQAEQLLLRHSWPGNIRELENTIRQALLACRDGRIKPDDLPAPLLCDRTANLVPAAAPRADAPRNDVGERTDALRQELRALYELGGACLWKQIEEAVFRTAYEHSDSNQLKTARLLGTTRSVVRARLLEFGVLGLPEQARRPSIDDEVPSKRVLVVEDDVAVRDALAQLLKDEGYEVSLAENGQAALDLLARAPAPNVIVLDLMMPIMDGWQFRGIQRGDPKLRDIPIVAISASEPKDTASLAAEVILRKPFESSALLSAVEEMRLIAAHAP